MQANNIISLDTLPKPISLLENFYNNALDNVDDEDIKKVVAAGQLIKERLANSGTNSNLTTEEITQIADAGVSSVKVAYKVGTGELDIIEASDYLIDYATAQVGTIVKTTCEKYGEKAGEFIGRFIGNIFSPAGAAVGAVIGAKVGAFAGKIIGEYIIPGIKKVAFFVKEIVSNICEGVKEVAIDIWEGITSIFS